MKNKVPFLMSAKVVLNIVFIITVVTCWTTVGYTSEKSKKSAQIAHHPEKKIKHGRKHHVINQCHKHLYNSPDTWAANQWLGVPTHQNPIDVWIIQEIITEVGPDYIIEAGTYQGGSAMIWAMILEQVNPHGKVITIDIEDPPAKVLEHPLYQNRISFMRGSSVSPEIVGEIERLTEGKKVLVILDSDHSKEHVLKELGVYAPMVNQGSYLIVQDSNINGNPVKPHYGPGPMEAIEEFLKGRDDFVSDLSRERWKITFHPKGYLKKVGEL